MSIFLPILSFLVTESWVCPSHGGNESARRVSENKKYCCDPMDCSLLGSFVHGIFQARILEYVAISSSRGSSQPKDWTHISCVFCIAGRFFTCWTIREAHLFLNKVLKNIVHGQSKPQGWAQHPRDGEADSPGVERMSKSYTRVQPREGRSTGEKDATRPVSLMVRPVCFFYMQLKTS